MLRKYHYIGPPEIPKRSQSAPKGAPITCVDDLRTWMKETAQKPNAQGLIVATFVVDLEGCLRIADRHSEHVACAGGEPVLSAGEIGFVLDGAEIGAVEVSNQSTGYCPEPESWPHVAHALDRIPVHHPGRFTLEVVFRRCCSCGQINIVKDNWMECLACGEELPQQWNLE
jgi:hypothetical protein